MTSRSRPSTGVGLNEKTAQGVLWAPAATAKSYGEQNQHVGDGVLALWGMEVGPPVALASEYNPLVTLHSVG